jgi:hypothetical protein
MPAKVGNISRTIRNLAIHGVSAFKPTVIKGYYQCALVKPRAAAHLRKRSVIDGSYGSFDPRRGGWNPEWDTHKNMYFLRPWKTHKRDRDREARAAKITKALETVVPQRIEKYRQVCGDVYVYIYVYIYVYDCVYVYICFVSVSVSMFVMLVSLSLN